MASTELVIFDCDGVLVDSEPISTKVLVASLGEAGIPIDEAFVYKNFLGRSLKSIQAMIEDDLGWTLPPGFHESMRARLFETLTAELRPIEGIADVLPKLEGRRCVASSSQPDRIRLSLRVTGLLDSFEPDIFSASMVPRGKPAPDLFLHAAEKLGVAPANCVVVEDSEAGILAAKAAKMRVLGFTGGSHAQTPDYPGRLGDAGADAVFDDMDRLLALVATV